MRTLSKRATITHHDTRPIGSPRIACPKIFDHLVDVVAWPGAGPPRAGLERRKGRVAGRLPRCRRSLVGICCYGSEIRYFPNISQTGTAPDVDAQLCKTVNFVQYCAKIVQNSPESSRKLTISNFSTFCYLKAARARLSQSPTLQRRPRGTPASKAKKVRGTSDLFILKSPRPG